MLKICFELIMGFDSLRYPIPKGSAENQFVPLGSG